MAKAAVRRWPSSSQRRRGRPAEAGAGGGHGDGTPHLQADEAGAATAESGEEGECRHHLAMAFGNLFEALMANAAGDEAFGKVQDSRSWVS